MSRSGRRHFHVTPAQRGNRAVNDDVDLDEECPLPEVFALISDKWTVQILHELRVGPRRFTELERAINGVSRRMLTLALRNLERNGLITRTVYPEVPPRVVYARTSLTNDLSKPLEALAAWAKRRRPDIAAARRAYDSRSTPAAPR
jgi:DNA-binding HxlR family transcriptional regulator